MNGDRQTESAASVLTDVPQKAVTGTVDTAEMPSTAAVTAAADPAGDVNETATGTGETPTGTKEITAEGAAADAAPATGTETDATATPAADVGADTAAGAGDAPLTWAEIERQRAAAQVLTPEEAAAEEEVRARIEALPCTYRKKPIYDFFKRLTDIVLSGLLLLVIWPVFLIIAVAIKCDDGGKVFYRHKRVGRYGRDLYVHKFRSMKRNADQLAGLLTPEQLHQYYTEFKIDDDPRITKVGHFLRKTSLDELPQVWDIFTGRLSIIGPRPLVETETQRYYGKREALLSVKPGLTGYWQAYARNDVGYADGRRQEMELFYVGHRSFRLDIKIFFKTIGSVLKRKGAK